MLLNPLFLLCLMVIALGRLPAAYGSYTTAQPKEVPPAVNVTSHRDGNATVFYVENHERCEITMTFDLGLKNLKCAGGATVTATFPAQQTSEAFRLEPINPAKEWEYSYTNYYKLGSNTAQHDESYAYQLPYAPGSRFKVTQAAGGKFSHTGSNLNAIDWQMPEGTPVYAARGGVVVRTKDDSTTGGGSIKFDPYNNYVLIRHGDGTLGHYCHLQKGGVCVKPGQIVKPGDLLARSGNTGFSSGPHLHFCVFKTIDGKERVSIPIHFKTVEEKFATLQEGKRYKAVELPATVTASTAVSAVPTL